jgi:GNAT superfamily N-acetyltransferase
MMKKSIKESINDILAHWNQEFSKSYPLTKQLLEDKIMFSKHTVWEGTFSICEDQDYVGTICLKYFRDDYEEFQDFAYISFLFVSSKYRNRGFGSKLLQEAISICEQDKKTNLYLGSDFDCLFSGLFVSNNEQTHDFFKKRGFAQAYRNFNLISGKRPSLDKDQLEYVQTKTKKEREQVFALIKEHFSYRWYYDVKDCGIHDFVVAKKQDQIVGFVRIAHPNFKIRANSINLSPLYKCLGGIGPLGIIPSERGRGTGSCLVKHATNILYDLNCSEIMVDWTGLIEFYKKCSYEKVSNEYVLYQKKLNVGGSYE